VDGVLMEKLLVNLIENAAKYTPPDTLVTISSERRGTLEMINVEDTGPGIPAGMENRLFEKFFRCQNEGSVAGSGLGLSICRAIAELHGGSIGASNGREGGAKFSVILPYAQLPTLES
jgi:two-component system sensor histidine kinase KdpD